MCGRFSNNLTEEKLKKYFSKIELEVSLETSYNVCPTHSCLVVKNREPYSFSFMNWGLLPVGRNKGNLLVNARSETVFEKATFKEHIRNQRCWVMADSFYEWKIIGKDKIPYRIILKNKEPMVFAGLYHEWMDNGIPYTGFVILTQKPNLEMSSLHHRAPIILNSEEKRKEWISDISDTRIMEMMEVPLEDDALDIYMVSKAVGNIRNNSEHLHREIPEPPKLF